ncbi:hypothetical protein [Chitinophaga parva]|nr:hypothetical protein [Chitinophaga parva]
MKRFLSILLLAIMCTQLLPVRALGKILFNNQIVEEHMHDEDPGKALKVKFHLVFNHVDYLASEIFLRELYSHYHEQLPLYPSREVQTPPPNC